MRELISNPWTVLGIVVVVIAFLQYVYKRYTIAENLKIKSKKGLSSYFFYRSNLKKMLRDVLKLERFQRDSLLVHLKEINFSGIAHDEMLNQRKEQMISIIEKIEYNKKYFDNLFFERNRCFRRDWDSLERLEFFELFQSFDSYYDYYLWGLSRGLNLDRILRYFTYQQKLMFRDSVRENINLSVSYNRRMFKKLERKCKI